jgi:hypothetical protein
MKRLSLLAVAALAAAASTVHARVPEDMVLTEWNAVADNERLIGTDPAFPTDDFANGGNWIELRVIEDELNIRGWVLLWENDDPDSGSITFTASQGAWASVPAGTIITIIEEDDDFDQGEPGADWGNVTDTSGTHWNIPLDNDPYVTHSGGFKVDNDNWRMKITDGTNTVQNWVGEDVAPGWTGSAVNDEEVGRLTVDPTAAGVTSTNGEYEDSNNSSFGTQP